MVGMPAPGDLRSTLASLAAEPESLFVRLLQHRFNSPDVSAMHGMAFGNLLLAAMTQLTGDFTESVRLLSEQVKSMAQILPVSSADTNLCAELEDGSIREHELEVRGLNKPRIRRVFLADPTARAYPPVLDAIAQANVVVIGPGSFYTSLLSTLLFDGVVEALRNTPATVAFVCNTTTQPGQTDGYTTFDHVQAMLDVLGPGALDVALINRSDTIDPALLSQYESEGLHLLRPDDDEIARIAALGVRPLVRDFVEKTEGKRELWEKLDTLRHDLEVLEMALWKLALDHAQP
jgi:uncharacterized cofD-like protein